MLYVFVEGPNDVMYFNEVYGGLFGVFKFIQYSDWQSVKVSSFLRSIDCMPMCDYIFVGDADGKSVGEKADELVRQYGNLSRDKVCVVQYEIESWFFAGVSQSTATKFKLKHYVHNTDSLTKEQFNTMIPRISERKLMMAQILAQYELDLALSRNQSLLLFDKRIRKEPA